MPEDPAVKSRCQIVHSTAARSRSPGHGAGSDSDDRRIRSTSRGTDELRRLVAGRGASILLTLLLRGFLFGVNPLDAATFAMTLMLLAMVAAVAIHRPARRATSVDPLQSLKME